MPEEGWSCQLAALGRLWNEYGFVRRLSLILNVLSLSYLLKHPSGDTGWAMLRKCRDGEKCLDWINKFEQVLDFAKFIFRKL